MALYDGFFNSESGDRTYRAEHFALYFKDLVLNGCLPESTGFLVEVNEEDIGADPSPSVNINPGKAVYDGLWFVSTAIEKYYLGPGKQTNPGMKHYVYICFDTDNADPDLDRSVYFGHVTGASPTLPANGNGKYYLPLALVVDNQSVQIDTIESDERIIAGIATQVADDAISNSKLQLNSVEGDNLASGLLLKSHFPVDTPIVATGSLEAGAATYPKLGAITCGMTHASQAYDLNPTGTPHKLGGSDLEISIPAQDRAGRLMVWGTLQISGNTRSMYTGKVSWSHDHGSSYSSTNKVWEHQHGIYANSQDDSAPGFFDLLLFLKYKIAGVEHASSTEMANVSVPPLGMEIMVPVAYTFDIPISSSVYTFYFNYQLADSGEHVDLGRYSTHLSWLLVPQ